MNTPITFHPLLDGDFLLEFYEADIEEIAWALTTFYNFTLKDFFKILPLAKEQDWVGVRNLSHRLKPNFKSVGLIIFYEKLAQLELTDYTETNLLENNLLKVRSLDEDMRILYLPVIELEIKRLSSL